MQPESRTPAADAEARRLQRLRELAVLDTEPEPLFDALTRAAADGCEVPIALISLVDETRQWFKSRVGLDVPSTARELAFCHHAIAMPAGGAELMEVEDAQRDERFTRNPLVTGEPSIRFYAGALLRLPSGEAMGTLCVVDRQPRSLSDRQRRLLRELATATVEGLLMRQRVLRSLQAERARHEAELTRSMSRRAGALNSILDDLPAAVGVWDRELGHVYTNRQHDAWYGPAMRLVATGRHALRLDELLTEADMRKLRPLLEIVMSGKPRVFEARQQTPEGPRYRRIHLSAHRDARGQIDGHTALITDQTSEREYAVARASLAAIVRNSSDAVFMVDGKGRVLSWNAGAERMFGRGEVEMLGRSVLLLMPESEHAGARERLARVLHGEEMPIYEALRLARDGGQAAVSISAFLVASESGESKRVCVVARDISELKANAQALRESEQRLRTLYEATPALLHSCDVNGRLLSVTDTWIRRFGRERESVLGQPQGDFMDEASREYLQREVWPQLLRVGRVENIPLRWLTASGGSVDVVYGALVEPAQGGHAPRVLVVMQDVSEAQRRAAELQREQALRGEIERRADELSSLLAERSQMLDVLAHEVRQPLNNASAALQSAQASLNPSDTDARARLDRAMLVLAQVRGGIDNTLAAAMLLASDEPLVVQDADVDLLIAVTLGDIDPGLRARLRVQRECETRTAAMDQSLMRLALRNLIVNALRYSPEGSPITVHLSDSDAPLALVIEVRDQGPGFAVDFLPRMFQRGSRGGAASTDPGQPTRRAPPGSGLGLYIVQRIMQRHGGEVVLAHNVPGDVRMRLVLPPPKEHDE